MSQTQIRESSLSPLKACKFLVLSPDKPCDFPAVFIRGTLLILIVTSLCVIISSLLSDESRWAQFPQCGDAAYDVNETRANDDPNPTDISHVVFGLGGSVKTWPTRRRYSELWWRPNATRGYVWLDAEPAEAGIGSWPESSPPYRVSEDWSRFKYSSSRSSVRIARIVLESFRLGHPGVRWFVMGDDDTVFFPDNLVSVLSRYDHRQMYYIGGSSESVEQDLMHSYGMAFGGGGFAVSYPLAAELSKVLDACIDRYYAFYGSDQRVWACVTELGVPLTREPGFHQLDIREDPYGLLAAHPVAPLVTLHHLDHVKPLLPNKDQLDSLKALIRAYQVDPARIVQQTFCHDAGRNVTLSVSWGYTAQVYPTTEVTAKDLEPPLQTFKTWRTWADGPFAFNTRPVNTDPCNRPVFYFLDRVMEVGMGRTKNRTRTLTNYKRAVPEAGKECGRAEYGAALSVNKIAVSAMKMDPRDWKMAPRRHCCEIDRSAKGSVMRVWIKKRCQKPVDIGLLMPGTACKLVRNDYANYP